MQKGDDKYYAVELYRAFLLTGSLGRRRRTNNNSSNNQYEMKPYSQLIDIPEMQETLFETTLKSDQEPYTLLLLNVAGKDITNCILGLEVVGEFYNVRIYSEIEYPQSELKITYQ